MIMRLYKKSPTGVEEERLGDARWTRDAEAGLDLLYITAHIPRDVVDFHLFEWGWTKVEEDGEHRYWRSPSGHPSINREEAFRIACIGRAERGRRC